ncbi:MAG: protease modulator HflC [Planctomycetota bacterium]|jgi:membrane protease subunit HflC
MRQLAIAAGGIVALLLLLSLSGATYIVDETQQVVVTQFGSPVGDPVTTPGLKWKLPFVQTANVFEKRFLEWDGDSNQLPTKDKRFIHVDTYARWKISDPLKFFQRLRDERGGQSRLDDILDGETRNTIANHHLIEVVRSTNRPFAVSEELGKEAEPEELKKIEFGRAVLAAEVLKAAQARTVDLGIEILDFRFKRINYVEQVRREVYARMISERNRIAEQFRAEGAGEAARINGERERELKTISSEAYRQAETVKGRADAEAANIYARIYGLDPEFYRFQKSMQVLNSTMNKDTVVLLATDGELMRYLETSK